MSTSSDSPGGTGTGARPGRRFRGAAVAAYLLVLAFFLVRFDFWAMADGSFSLGLPWGLTYHVLYCLAAVGVLALLVKVAWPSDLEPADLEASNRAKTAGPEERA